MRLFILNLVVCAFFVSPVPLLAQEGAQEGESKTSTMILQELKTLSRKMDELKTQNRTLLEKQGQILQELASLKIHVRRRS